MTALASTVHRNVRGSIASGRVNLIEAAQYRVSSLIWAVVSILQAVVYLSVWSAVADAGGGSTGGFTPGEFAGYFLVVLCLRTIVVTPTPMGEFATNVRSGLLAAHLLRPVHPLAALSGAALAHRIQSALAMPAIALVLMVAFDATIDVRGVAWFALLLVVPLAILTKLLADSLLACLAMWLTRIDGVRGVYNLVIILLGGQFAPLDVLPDTMATVSRALPFYWTLGYPAELAIGRAPLADIWIAIAVLGAWSIALYTLVQPVWRAGTRAYEAVGT